MNASMRPRHKAAENRYEGEFAGGQPNGASMRPRHKAAENRVNPPPRASHVRASMRPRHKAAENNDARRSAPAIRSSFNEAAA